MRKHFVLASLMLSLLTLTALMPVVKAVTYSWDGVRFVEGQLSPGHYIKYPHPDRDYYGISPYSVWSKEGVKLYHNQIDHDKSENAKIGIVAVFGVIGLLIGATLAPPWGAVIGGTVGLVLGAIAAGAGVVLQDELGCVWWWISIDFMDWLSGNLWWLGPLAGLCPAVAEAEILGAFLLCGYLRVGSGTIYDAVGAGNPSNTLTISAEEGGTTSPAPGTHEYAKGTYVTVTASSYSGWTFDYWVKDGVSRMYSPITILMDSDHTLRAYFKRPSGGGGGYIAPGDPGDQGYEEGF